MTVLSTDERDELAQSVRAACEKFAPEERVRAVAYDHDGAGERGFDSELWKVLCNQVGVAAIAVPEHLGGAGYGASALGVVAHELGRVLAPVPFVGSTSTAKRMRLNGRAARPGRSAGCRRRARPRASRNTCTRRGSPPRSTRPSSS